MGTMTFAEAAESVLADLRRAMTADELWAEIDRRGLVQTKGTTPSATLYTTLLRKSATYLSEDDDRTPQFYRRGDGAWGCWTDLNPQQQKAVLEGKAIPSGVLLYPEVKLIPSLVFIADSHRLTATGIDLTTDWRTIHQRLVAIIDAA